MPHPANDIFNELKSRLSGIDKGRIAFIGVGNRLRGDDAIGPALIDRLSGKATNAIDAGITPENVTGTIKRIRPSAIIFFDAVDLGKKSPGYARIIEIGEIGGYDITTHKIPLDKVMSYLKEETGADVFLIGIQPERISDVEELSENAIKSIEEIASAIKNILTLPCF
jgi:hydrogenase 3 maturation protease